MSEAGVNVAENAVLWTMGGSSFVSQWDYPTVLQVLENNDTWTEEQRVIQLPDANKWVYVIIQSAFAQDHPIHLREYSLCSHLPYPVFYFMHRDWD